MPPNESGLKIEMPPMLLATCAPPNPPRPAASDGCTPAGVGSAPILPQLLCGLVYSSSEHGSCWIEIVDIPLWAPTNSIPSSGSAAAPPSMFTPPLAPGAYHEHLYCAGPFLPLPSAGDGGMKYGPIRQCCASFNAESLIAGV